MVDKVLLATSVCPLVWGCYVVLNINLVPNLAHKHLQKWLRNLISRSETIVFGTPCNDQFHERTNQQVVQQHQFCDKK
jgi:hypothetical protein